MPKRESVWQRLNRALTEVGVEHFDDDKDWDERVKLPAWQTARLRARYEAKMQQPRLSSTKPSEDKS